MYIADKSSRKKTRTFYMPLKEIGHNFKNFLDTFQLKICLLLAPQNLIRKIEGKISRVSQFQNAVKMCRIEFEC